MKGNSSTQTVLDLLNEQIEWERSDAKKRHNIYMLTVQNMYLLFPESSLETKFDVEYRSIICVICCRNKAKETSYSVLSDRIRDWVYLHMMQCHREFVTAMMLSQLGEER